MSTKKESIITAHAWFCGPTPHCSVNSYQEMEMEGKHQQNILKRCSLRKTLFDNYNNDCSHDVRFV